MPVPFMEGVLLFKKKNGGKKKSEVVHKSFHKYLFIALYIADLVQAFFFFFFMCAQ